MIVVVIAPFCVPRCGEVRRWEGGSCQAPVTGFGELISADKRVGDDSSEPSETAEKVPLVLEYILYIVVQYNFILNIL
ncbi:hypothetical protein SPTER_32640 [Sporomusa termitida]|uniref:Uncharacterized protein n=1 Tax=Sporomusa termitida TaxID=2377 RepID=A0A517DWX4_9FIRM|nr:hypothetical protein SPTER_32640 [Sporomusa termitida]